MMKHLSAFILFTALSAPLFFLGSCSQDSYEKGEGEYSLMRGDFVEAQVNGEKQIVSFTTDEGDKFTLSEPYTAKWITTADTLYRCMLYYNKVGMIQDNLSAKVVTLAEVPCPVVKTFAEFDKEFRTDPVKFESIWLSKSKKYLNLHLLVKTGVTDDTTAIQQLAFLSDTLIVHPNGTRTHHILLHHNQNRVPEYYSTKLYVSIPTACIAADSVRMSINTYDGKVVKCLPLHK